MAIFFHDLFKISLGPSSSHTAGPMLAAHRFATILAGEAGLPRVRALRVTLLGSLARTGSGHRTATGILLGLTGHRPEDIDPDAIPALEAAVAADGLTIEDQTFPFSPESDIVFDCDSPTPVHPNTLTFAALDGQGGVVVEKTYYSVGGGFIRAEGEADDAAAAPDLRPYPFTSGAELLEIAERTGLRIADIVRHNEAAFGAGNRLADDVLAIHRAMMAAIASGLATEGVLPGGLNVRRRAKRLCGLNKAPRNDGIPRDPIMMASIYAIAVSEENAAGGRIVTAPTNGAAGVIPSVLKTMEHYSESVTSTDVEDFFLAATAVGSLIKMNASISGAEVGCQGEIGSASAMAAAGLTCCMGGSDRQILNAAEIAMEHHLGMTCDPIGGLVQIPCIERNAFGAVKAISASHLALSGDDSQMVSFDRVIRAMYETGKDLRQEYRETSLGGLALWFPEC